MIAKALPFGVALLVVTACGGSDSAVGRGDDGTGTGTGVGSATASSTPAQKTSLCTALDAKKCDLGSSGVAGCEERLNGTSGAYVEAIERCVKAQSDCDDIWDTCTEKAVAEIAPGYPNVPPITQCKDKNLECGTKYAPSSTDPDNSTIKSEVDDACELVIVLDEAGQNRAAECRAKDCDAFAECIRVLTDDVE